MSYFTDVFLLCGFVFAGSIPWRVPVVYGAAGAAECMLAWFLFKTSLPRRLHDEHLTLLRFVLSCAIQVAGIALVPQLAFLFLTALFIVFGFATLGLRTRDAMAVWAIVAIVVGAIVIRVPELFLVPHATLLQRVLVGATVMMSLARCTILGTFSSHLRNVVSFHLQNARRSLESNDEERARTATILHEDLGQDLVGISLMLSACVSRLRRRGELDAADMELATKQLCTAIQKTRLIAAAARPVARGVQTLVKSAAKPLAGGQR